MWKLMMAAHTYELIGDMVNSAELEDRNHPSERLHEAMERLVHEMAYSQ